MKRLAAIVCATTLAMAALSGCGSDDSSDSGSSDNSSSSSSSSGSSSSDSSSSDSGDSSSDDSSSDDSASSDYCSQVKSLKDDFNEVASGSSVNDMRSSVDKIKGIEDSAPSDVSDSWESIYGAMDKVVSNLENSGIDKDQPLQKAVEAYMKKNPSKAQAFAKKFQGMTSATQDVEAEGKKITAEVKQDCGFDMDS